MKKIVVLGAGKIGEAICALLSLSDQYQVTICDKDQKKVKSISKNWENVFVKEIDISKIESLVEAFKGQTAVISALPYFCNFTVAQAALKANIHYFDLTEDVATTEKIKKLAKKAKKSFVPQCGLAPGFIGLATATLVKYFDTLKSVKMRVGALPKIPSNRLKYNLTWSTEGLINEYCNPCDIIHDGKLKTVLPMEGYEQFILFGEELEAFYTSGGIGSICELLKGKVDTLDYKTVRYHGHRDLMMFLLDDLGLRHKRTLLKEIFEASIPRTIQDKCIVFVEVTGWKDGELLQRSFANAIFHQMIGHKEFGAIQVSTAAAACAVLDMVLCKKNQPKGFLGNEYFTLDQFLDNRFGKYYRS